VPVSLRIYEVTGTWEFNESLPVSALNDSGRSIEKTRKRVTSDVTLDRLSGKSFLRFRIACIRAGNIEDVRIWFGICQGFYALFFN
jgi:hypothetical protein